MKFPPHWRLPALALLSGGRLCAGETLVVDGYAQRQTSTSPIVISLSPWEGGVLTVPAAPGDRSFTPPDYIRWEVQLDGTSTGSDLTGVALRSAPDDFAWPAGEEISPDRYNGSISGMFPSENTLDPLGVAPGSGIADYDGDGVPDATDAFPGDPKEWVDTDGDGIGNNADLDDDNDGMPDVWEIAHGTNPLVNDARADPDHDGFTNFQEYEAGTDPQDPNSLLKFSQIQVSPTTVTLTFWALPGFTYAILHNPTLSGEKVAVSSGIRVTDHIQLLSVDVRRTTASDFYFLQVAIDPVSP